MVVTTRGRAALVAVALLAVVAWDFFAATTFLGDDHLFLTFARHTGNPLSAFVVDRHGGEYYRPLPMALWWLLARAGRGSPLPFAALALALHAAAALLAGALARTTGRTPATALLAAALFLVAPGTREAALWFSASTDLLATVATLGALLCLLRGAHVASLVLAAAAYLSKESALALPLLAAAVLRLGDERRSLRPLWAHAVVAAAALAARALVLGRLGGAGDAGPALPGKLLQIAAGVAQALGTAPLPDAAALAAGAGLVGWGAWGAWRRARAGERAALLPLAWIGASVLPLLGAGWVVGARYFYLPAAGVALLLADRLQESRPSREEKSLARILLVLALLVLGTLAAAGRRAEVLAYRARLAVAADAVASALAQGHRLVHVRCGIKDLDLALENRWPAHDGDLVVLSDVPASFVLVPADPVLAERTRFLRAAHPPLPPSGAYRWGGREVVGLARRAEAPSLADVLARLPELRFIELVEGPRGLSFRDVTDERRAP